MNKLAVIVLLAGLAACSDKRPEEGRAPMQAAGPVIGSAAPGAPAPAPGEGSQVPGSAGSAAPGSAAPGSAATGSAAGSWGMACATGAALACDAGQRDGCDGGLTSVHVCVAKDAKAGPPCAQEIALTCPTGQVDACLQAPPQANNHVCVIVPAPAP